MSNAGRRPIWETRPPPWRYARRSTTIGASRLRARSREEFVMAADPNRVILTGENPFIRLSADRRRPASPPMPASGASSPARRGRGMCSI